MPNYDEDRTQGALFNNQQKQQDNHPDMRGELTISKALLRELVEKAKEGEQPKLTLAVWKKTSKNGNAYMSLSGQIFKDWKTESRGDSKDVPW